jgi:hypothetical protein
MNRWLRGLAIALMAAGILVAPQGVAVTNGSEDTAAVVSSGSSLDAPNEACSPPPQCWRDRDCDRVCGKNNGQCIQVNSCYRECACAS